MGSRAEELVDHKVFGADYSDKMVECTDDECSDSGNLKHSAH